MRIGFIILMFLSTDFLKAQMVLTFSSKNVSCFGLCDGSVGVNVVGGLSPYSYLWLTSPIQTTMSVSSLCASNYNVIVTDAIGSTVMGQISITEPAKIILACSATPDTVQSGDSTQLSSVMTGGTPPYTYFWSPPNILDDPNISHPKAHIILPTCFYFMGTDSMGCWDTCKTCVYVYPVNGLDENNKSDRLSIYPNPTSVGSEISWSKQVVQAKLKIHTNLGALIYERDHVSGNALQIDKWGLPPGIYFVCLVDKNGLIASGSLSVVDW